MASLLAEGEAQDVKSARTFPELSDLLTSGRALHQTINRSRPESEIGADYRKKKGRDIVGCCD